MEELSVLARVLKQSRKDRGWTLADVAERSGISVTTLSKVERGMLSLTYEKIIDLARGLGIEVGRFFHDGPSELAQPSSRRSVTRAGDGVSFESGAMACRYLSTDLLNKAFYPLAYEVKSRSLEEFGPMTAHDGEQFVYVLEGELEIHTEHYEPVRLYAGDSFYFDSSMRHAAFKIGEGPCRVLGILSALDTRGTEAIQESRTQEIERWRSAGARSMPQRREAIEPPKRQRAGMKKRDSGR